MSRLLLLISVIGITLAGLVAHLVTPAAAAQDVGPAAGQHPLVGSWFWENISDDPFDDSYAVFGADGTYVEETAYIGAGIGSWNPTWRALR